MSESDGGAGQREVAYRVFAAEYDDADLDYSEGEDERSPNYVVTPTGARVNRLFVVGVLTEVEQVSEDVLRARVVDPTGAFVLYAGQYQPDEQAFLERAEPPMFVAVTGKARTFSPDDSEQVYTSVRPESINEVDAETRDRWTVQAAEETLYRVEHAARALSMDERGDALTAALAERGVEEGLAAGIPLALDHYGTTPTYLGAVRELVLNAARVVAGEREEVGDLTVAPDEAGSVTVKDLVEQLEDVTTVPATVADETDPATAATAGQSPADSTDQTTADIPDRTEAAATDEPTGVESSTETAVTETASETTATEAASETTAAETTATESTPEETADTTGDTSTAETTEDASADETGGGPTAEVTDPGDFDPEEFELEEETREEIEEEYGTEFQTGTEVEDPGEAGIETPDPDESGAGDTAAAEDTTAEAVETERETESVADESAPAETETDGTATAETGAGDTAETDAGDTAETDASDTAETGASDAVEPDASDTAETGEPAEEPDDLVEAVVEVMGELDDGDGADRETLVGRVTDRYGTAPEDVEDAIQEALMDGKCYEPDDTSVKPI